ncbi:aminomethyl transferase family protein [Kineosporiaceae bacterium B12]|nr:aminomethyl transferase family protein [Kineococcus rubinsiae]
MPAPASETLAEGIARAGSAEQLLRHSPARPTVFPVTAEFSNWRSEQLSWRRSCALLDQSHHMTDLFLTGPDALRLLADTGVNSFARFAPGGAKQFVAVTEEGLLVGDAILFHLEQDHLDLVGHPMVIDWVQFHAETGGYRVQLQRDGNSIVRRGAPTLYRYELQGPTALAVVEQLIGGPVPEVRFFRTAEFEVAGHRVRALRHGMAGQPGFELFGPWAQGEAVHDAILRAGADHDLVEVGAKGYSTANLESGWVPAPLPAVFTSASTAAYRDWLPAARAGSLGGSFASPDIEDYSLSPDDLGYGRSVAFDHDFLGRSALEAVAAAPPRRRKVTLVWDRRDVAAAQATLFDEELPAKFIELPKARYALHHVDEVRHEGAHAGLSLDCGYVANERSFLSLATVAADLADGSEVVVVWGEEPNSRKPQVEPHRQVEVRAVVAPAPFPGYASSRYRTS